MSEFMGVHEIAECLSRCWQRTVTRQTAHYHTTRADFPEPLDRLAMGPVYRRTDVEHYARMRSEEAA